MSVLLGGAGSSGSTLLRIVLDNHPDIFSGAELNFFNKQRLFEQWDRYKHQAAANRRRLVTDGWFPYPGTNLRHPDYGWTESTELNDLIDRSDALHTFAHAFFARRVTELKKSIWVEKTPSNTYNFSRFLAISEEHKVIHLVRDPYDTVASLYRRGMSPYFAAGLWVYNNAAALSAADSRRYIRIKYEDLVTNTSGTLAELTAFIGVNAVKSCVLHKVPEPTGSPCGISSWQNQPDGAVSNSSINGFERLPAAIQAELAFALQVFRIRERVAQSHNLAFRSAHDLCNVFGYATREPSGDFSGQILWQLVRDFARRSIRRYSTGLSMYPGTAMFA